LTDCYARPRDGVALANDISSCHPLLRGACALRRSRHEPVRRRATSFRALAPADRVHGRRTVYNPRKLHRPTSRPKPQRRAWQGQDKIWPLVIATPERLFCSASRIKAGTVQSERPQTCARSLAGQTKRPPEGGLSVALTLIQIRQRVRAFLRRS
jgi:hypothetical protein